MMEHSLRISRDSLSRPWGFRLQEGLCTVPSLFVQKIFDNSPSKGVLQEGDVLRFIDDQDCCRLNSREALDLIRVSRKSLNLKVYRGDISTRTPLLLRSSRSSTNKLGSDTLLDYRSVAPSAGHDWHFPVGEPHQPQEHRPKASISGITVHPQPTTQVHHPQTTSEQHEFQQQDMSPPGETSRSRRRMPPQPPSPHLVSAVPRKLIPPSRFRNEKRDEILRNIQDDPDYSFCHQSVVQRCRLFDEPLHVRQSSLQPFCPQWLLENEVDNEFKLQDEDYSPTTASSIKRSEIGWCPSSEENAKFASPARQSLAEMGASRNTRQSSVGRNFPRLLSNGNEPLNKHQSEQPFYQSGQHFRPLSGSIGRSSLLSPPWPEQDFTDSEVFTASHQHQQQMQRWASPPRIGEFGGDTIVYDDTDMELPLNGSRGASVDKFASSSRFNTFPRRVRVAPTASTRHNKATNQFTKPTITHNPVELDWNQSQVFRIVSASNYTDQEGPRPLKFLLDPDHRQITTQSDPIVTAVPLPATKCQHQPLIIASSGSAWSPPQSQRHSQQQQYWEKDYYMAPSAMSTPHKSPPRMGRRSTDPQMTGDVVIPKRQQHQQNAAPNHTHKQRSALKPKPVYPPGTGDPIGHTHKKSAMPNVTFNSHVTKRDKEGDDEDEDVPLGVSAF